MPDVDSVRAWALGSVPFFRRRQHRKNIKRPAIATAARTPITIPAIAPPDGEELLPELSGPLVAVTLADDAGEVVVAAVAEEEDVASVVDSAAAAVEENAAVLLFTLNDKICWLEG